MIEKELYKLSLNAIKKNEVPIAAIIVKNNKIISYTDIINNYNLYLTLNKNDLIKITTKDGKESIAYVVGCSSGMLEVKSKLGDGYDIIVNSFNKNNIFIKQRAQYQITVSTIKEIKKLSISVLGEISGL